MADTKISALANAATLGGTEQMAGVQSAGNVNITPAQIATYMGISSGTYTPTLTNVSNLDGSTAYLCQYMRVGSVVTVSGRVDVNPTLANSINLGISLPIASNFGAATGADCGGAAANSGATMETAAIYGDDANNRANLTKTTALVADHSMFFSFTYRII